MIKFMTGMDMNCGSYLQQHTKSAVEQKKLPQAAIDRAVRNLFSVRIRLGLLDGNPSKLPYGDIGPNQVCSPEHQNLALEAARNGIVLLKNSARLLPLPKTKIMSLAVIGPNADAPQTLIGNYAGIPCKYVTPLQGFRGYVKDVRFHPGCNTVACSSAEITTAVEVAKAAEYVVLVMGLDQTQEREDRDRVSLKLPGKQRSLIQSVAKAVRKPVVLVLLCGGPIDISFAKDDQSIGGILWAGYPGEAGGAALAEVIFGDHNPGGRLPVTWYPQDFTKVPMTDMRMRSDPASGYPGRTYRFYRGAEVFKFGYGLSYSKYSYQFTSVKQNLLYLNQSSNFEAFTNSESIRYAPVSEMGTEVCEQMKFSTIIGVENQGDMAGRHPVLLFVRQEKSRNGSPVKQLVGFRSVHLNAGERSEIKFVLSPCEHLGRANENGLMVMEEGSHFLVVGDEEYKVTVVA